MLHLSIRCPGCGTDHQFLLGDEAPGESICSACNRHLFRYGAVVGFLYILSHPHMPGLLKIGFTTRPVEERVQELSSSTGVPGAFTPEAYFISDSPEAHEAEVFRLLSPHRLPGKEFFRSDVVHVMKTMETVAGRAPCYARAEIVRAERARLERLAQEKAQMERAAQEKLRQVTFRCPHCCRPIVLPDRSATLMLRCPNCNVNISYSPSGIMAY